MNAFLDRYRIRRDAARTRAAVDRALRVTGSRAVRDEFANR